MLARELGFLQGFRLLGRDPEAPSATPERRFLILNSRRSEDQKSKDRRALLQMLCTSSCSHRDRGRKAEALTFW